ncbi:hypothetical protein [Streptomyces erythrochromogenes]|uniref:hypothetical protein n=1 Tax=Streptomyces erythrochromogenes TaxID=285574 RepID=UPI00386E9D5E|nr:hypothetical protein OG364_00580 [Streptomyces erythrochromogenes]WST98428.1 hypothetical protein OG364_40955 [Streptomyces erythrochromogenes]
MTTDLGLLTTAADKWESMAGEIKKVEERYRDTVQKVSMGTNWTGISAGVARTNFAGTRYEYAAAQIQAKAVASLLRDAHSQFTDLKKRLESVRADAVKEGLVVDSQGNVRQDESKLTGQDRMYLRDHPEAVAARNKAIEAWAQRIKDLVQAFADADQGVKVALEAVGVDSNKDAFGKGNDDQLNGFNAGAQGDIEVYEARNAEDIATRINSGGNISAADYAELDRSFRDNAGNKAFSQTFLSGIGPAGTITLTDKLNDRALHSDKKNSDRYQDIQKGLANTLAGATEVPGKVSETPPGSKKFKDWLASPDGKFYREFTDGLDKAGVTATGTKANPLYGYQSFVTLMQHADTRYDDQFLYDLGDDLISAEKKHPGIFTKWGAGHDGVETDAIDGLLDVMSKNPDAATAFFDAKGNGPDGDKVTNDHLHYLAGSGNGTRDWPVNTVLGYHNTDLDDPTSRAGLGAALEAATTGHSPLGRHQDPWPVTPHTDAQARIMHDVVGELGPSQKVHENLREPLARALASYTEDTHQILGGMGSSQYITAATGDGFFREGEKVHMAVSEKDLAQFMRGLSDDPEAYATLHKAESRYISLEMEKIPQGATGFAQSNPLSNAGATLGAYSAIREDVLNDDRMAAYSAADWKSKMAYHVIGGAVTPMYFTTAGGMSIAFGDSLQRGVDTWAWTMGNNLKAEADATANAGIADHYLDANHQMRLMVDSWADGRTDIDEDAKSGLKNAILSGHDRGTNTTQKYLTDTTN